MFRDVAGWSNTTVAIERDGADEPDWVTATFVTENYFDVLGVRPAAGPGLPATRSGDTPLVAVVSRALREPH